MDSSIIPSITKSDVYLGFWINWSNGRVRGATLTLTNRDGGFLTAFLAVFVVFTGRSFWRIACFVLHYALSSDTPRDGIYHQRQAILRNATSGTSGLLNLLQINWTWRKHTQAQPYQRLLPIIIFAFFTISGFSVAGIFSSRISTSMKDEVLLLGRNCGFGLTGYIDTGTRFQTYLPYLNQRMVSSTSYARRCYRDNVLSQDCPIFVQKSLPWNSTYDIGCPFSGQDKICHRNSTNLRLDTGYIDSNLDLGINTPPEYRFLYRQVVECAPLKTEGYSKNVTIYSRQNNATSKQRMQYYYGKLPNTSDEWTYQYSAGAPIAIGGEDSRFTDPQYDYTIDVYTASFAPNGSIISGSSFHPVSDLLSPAADVTIVFLSANDILFTEPIKDDWYAADRPTTIQPKFLREHPGSHSFYVRNEPVGVLGCRSQHQYCSLNAGPNSNCTPLGGYWQIRPLTDRLWQTERQKAFFKWSVTRFWELSSQRISSMITRLGISSLVARDSLASKIQGPLPDNQWQKEVEYWFTSILADNQRLPVEVATGPLDANFSRLLLSPPSYEQSVLCGSQKIRSTFCTSFSVLGLAVLLSIGGTIVVVSWTMESLGKWISKRSHHGTYQCLEWTLNDTLQLQRLAHEELGLGTWSRTAKCHPITMPGKLLATIRISDSKHPKLKSYISEASLGIPVRVCPSSRYCQGSNYTLATD